MKEDTWFEKQLRRQPPRTLPTDWKREILEAARQERAVSAEWLSGSTAQRGASVWRGLRNWLWPHPAAWAGLAVVWVVVWGFHLSSSEQVAMTPERNVPLAEDSVLALADYRQSWERFWGELRFGRSREDVDKTRSKTTPRSRLERGPRMG